MSFVKNRRPGAYFSPHLSFRTTYQPPLRFMELNAILDETMDTKSSRSAPATAAGVRLVKLDFAVETTPTIYVYVRIASGRPAAPCDAKYMRERGRSNALFYLCRSSSPAFYGLNSAVQQREKAKADTRSSLGNVLLDGWPGAKKGASI